MTRRDHLILLSASALLLGGIAHAADADADAEQARKAKPATAPPTKPVATPEKKLAPIVATAPRVAAEATPAFGPGGFPIPTVRIRDIARVESVRSNQLVGYGLVVGLNGTGDSAQSPFTVQSVVAMLQRFGVAVDPRTLKTRNVAAVLITAEIPAFAKNGSRLDVTVSSIGDAASLQGGTLLQTPLLGADENLYAVCKGGCRSVALRRAVVETARPRTIPPPGASPMGRLSSGRSRPSSRIATVRCASTSRSPTSTMRFGSPPP